jgi:hypothetical protein
MMAKQKLTILQVIARSGISKRTHLPWEIHTAQCVLEQENSEGKQLLVGTINLPNALKDSPPGDYLAEFAFQQSMEGKLEPRIVSLTAFGRTTAKPAANATA